MERIPQTLRGYRMFTNRKFFRVKSAQYVTPLAETKASEQICKCRDLHPHFQRCIRAIPRGALGIYLRVTYIWKFHIPVPTCNPRENIHGFCFMIGYFNIGASDVLKFNLLYGRGMNSETLREIDFM